jgi:molybdate transport system ATP-binding protein
VRLEAHAKVQRGSFALDCELAADAGETLVIAGPNGAGKSTLVEVLAGLLPLDSGEVSLDGEIWERTADGTRVSARRRSVGVLFQGLWLFPGLSARDNVAYGLRARGVGRREARARAEALLARLELESVAERRPSELSGGEAQLVALARALAPEPKLLLLDEPLSALDVERRPHVRALLQSALLSFPGVRVVITHDPLEAMLLADRLAILESGRIVQSGRRDALRERPGSRYTASLVGQNLIAGVLRAPGRLEFDGGVLVVPADTVTIGREALARIEPTAIALATARPASSARNVLRGRIQALDPHGARVRVRLATTPPLVSEITPEAVEALGLRVGLEVWASVKATEIDVYPRETLC